MVRWRGSSQLARVIRRGVWLRRRTRGRVGMVGKGLRAGIGAYDGREEQGDMYFGLYARLWLRGSKQRQGSRASRADNTS